MTSPLPHLRYEKKFIAEGCTLAEILATVKRHPSAFREAYPPRVVNNLYLDSPSRRDYHDHINGAANRTKTRVRWYGARFEAAERPMLERKLKRGMVSGKEAYQIPTLSINGGCLRSLLGALFDAALIPPIVCATLRHMEPALFNRYQRHYFMSRDGKFRLTVDCGLQFAGMSCEHRQSIDLSPPVKTLILELKFGPALAMDADLITNVLPFRVARFSKYVAGIERI
jgi:VTC domain-containing protein